MFPASSDLADIVEQAATGILVHDAASKNVLWANPAACRMFGYSVSELRQLKAHHTSARERQYRRELGISWLQSAVVTGQSRRQWRYQSKNSSTSAPDPSWWWRSA